MLFSLALLTGIFTYRDYGVGWDEETQREIGLVSYEYVTAKSNGLETYVCRDHGVIFEMFLVFAEKVAGLPQLTKSFAADDDSFRQVFFLRHLLSHCLFLLAAFCVYRLLMLLYGSRLTALCGALMLLLHPVIYGQSFFNSKDVPFLSLIMIAFYAHVVALGKQKIGYFVLCGIVTGLLLNVRLTGALFVALFAGAQFFYFIRRKRPGAAFGYPILFVSVVLITLIASWPFLWNDPVNRFLWVFGVMSKFPFEWPTLFMGEYTPSPDLPWYYIPWWFAVNTPAPFLLLGAVGIIVFSAGLFSRQKRAEVHPLNEHLFLFALAFLLPVVVILSLDSVVYDGWRHMFFIYGGFVLMAAHGFEVCRRVLAQRKLAAVMLLIFVPSVVFMLRFHPLHHLYFNVFTCRDSGNYHKRFELDHWGVAYKQAYEYIAAVDTSQVLKISWQNQPAEMNYRMLSPELRQRIQLHGIAGSDYFITNYRWHPGEYTEPELAGREWKYIEVAGKKPIAIYKPRNP